ncbi:MAG: hypothetical protein KBD19_01920 [Candidatus Moranbacteria bacterium]|nr:hypothetical protein [Candidatus Moranbacteria bacterium]
MKKLFMYAMAAMLVFAPMAVSAQFGTIDSTGTTLSTVGSNAEMSNLTFGQIINLILNWLIGILGIGAIISFVIAGILYLTAAGDEAKTEKAKSMMTYAIIAVVVALIGFIAIRLVTNLVGGGTIGTGNVI